MGDAMRPASILEFLVDALDIWPFRPTYRIADPHEQDALAIRSDWEAVGRDLAGVIGRKHGQG